ncbi:hypothetical protein E4T48_01834 [Aureobasidium sp. EXF-10727]|nr:hypothetical protein E4T48_01834 [Aureobasidium sp. EXF-10727]KAI4728880.1 hypothetical protein E4T49_03328 [Aureobasidium sp. EXF-10728]
MLSPRGNLLFTFWLCSLWTQARCMDVAPYSALSPDPVYPSTSGNFTWPRGATTGLFTEGSTMIISWTTQYSNVNLWLIINQSWASPISLVSGYSTPYYEWQVKCGQNCSEPFLLRAVNAGGDDYEQQHGGFYSYQFWIKPADGTTQTTTVPFTTVSTKADLVPTVPSTSTSSPSSTSISTGSTSLSAPTTASIATPTPSSTSTNSSAPTSGTTPTVAIGVGVGAGVAAALICLGAFLLWRRRHRRNKNAHTHPPPIEMYEQAWQKHQDSSIMYPPSRMPSSTKSAQPAEAPGWQTDPYELPAHDSRELGVTR